MKQFVSLGILAALLVGCTQNTQQTPAKPVVASALKKPAIAVNLSDDLNTPDGMTLAKDGSIIVAIPNFNDNKDNKNPAYLCKISADNKLEKWFKLPAHPETKIACPLGIDFGSDGNLYVADCQGFNGGAAANYKSRMLRITVKDGKPSKCDVVAEGFVFINAIACYGDSVYCTESKFSPEPGKGPMQSGVYRFKLSELKDKPIKVSQGGNDPHVVYKLTTKSEDWKVGANGMGFAPDGTMYVCNFGDAAINAVKFDVTGKVVSDKVIAQGGAMKSTDGMKVCPKTGKIIVADFLGNAIHCVDPATGKVMTVAKNENGTGEGGALDKCSEVCLRDGKIYVANIDLNLDNNKFDKPYTISVIDMTAGCGPATGTGCSGCGGQK